MTQATMTPHTQEPNARPKLEGRLESLNGTNRKPAAFLPFNANPQNADSVNHCERALGALAPSHTHIRARESNLPRSLKMSINQFAHQQGQLRSEEVRDLMFAKVSAKARSGVTGEELAMFFADLQSDFAGEVPKNITDFKEK